MNYSVCAILRMPHSCDGGGSLSEYFSSGEVFFFFFLFASAGKCGIYECAARKIARCADKVARQSWWRCIIRSDVSRFRWL